MHKGFAYTATVGFTDWDTEVELAEAIESYVPVLYRDIMQRAFSDGIQEVPLSWFHWSVVVRPGERRLWAYAHLPGYDPVAEMSLTAKQRTAFRSRSKASSNHCGS